MRLGSGPDAAAEARRAIAALRADLDPPLMETLRLLVTELVTNSVRHTECDSLTLRVAIGKAAVLTEVADDGPASTPTRRSTPSSCRRADPDSGWGLFLVQRLARDWGVKDDGALEAGLVRARAAPRASAGDRPGSGDLLAEQGAEALSRRGRVVAAVVVERHVHLAGALGERARAAARSLASSSSVYCQAKRSATDLPVR